MDQVIEVIQSQPSLNSLIDSLSSKADVITTSAGTVVGSTTDLMNRISQIELPTFTVGTAVLLSYQSRNVISACQSAYLAECSRFLISASSESALQVADKVAIVLRKVASVACTIDKAGCAIRPMKMSMDMLSTSPYCLTSAQALFMQLCVASKMYHLGIEYLQEVEKLELHPSTVILTPAEYLLFFYYSGLCYVAVKDYSSALEEFNQVISCPATLLSEIAVSAIKKACLVSLIAHGKQFHLPRNCSAKVSNFYSQLSNSPYQDISRAFESDDYSKLAANVEIQKEVLEGDLNLGLAKQVVEALITHRIRRLTLTFSNLPLSELPRRIMAGVKNDKPEAAVQTEIESKICQMIHRKQIFAKIDQSQGMVYFYETEEEMCPSMTGDTKTLIEQQKTIQQGLEESMRLSLRLRELHKEVLTSPEYLIKTSSSSGHRPLRQGSPGEMMEYE